MPIPFFKPLELIKVIPGIYGSGDRVAKLSKEKFDLINKPDVTPEDPAVKAIDEKVDKEKKTIVDIFLTLLPDDLEQTLRDAGAEESLESFFSALYRLAGWLCEAIENGVRIYVAYVAFAKARKSLEAPDQVGPSPA